MTRFAIFIVLAGASITLISWFAGDSSAETNASDYLEVHDV